MKQNYGFMPEAQAEQAILASQGSYGPSAQWITHELYDTLAFPATPLTMDFFTIGTSGTKTLAKTNMKQGGQLPMNQEFRFHKVEISLLNKGALAADQDADTQAAITALQESWFQLVIDGREYDLQFSGAGLLPSMVGVGATAGSVGRFMSAGSKKLTAAINLGRLTSFAMRVNFDTAATASLAVLEADACELQVRLVGQLKRRI